MSDLNQEEMDLLLRIKEKPELQGYFFKKIKSLKWFDDVYTLGFLDAKKIPRLIEKEKGVFNMPYWAVLDFLVESSKKISVDNNLEFAEKYLQLMREYTSYCRKEKISNYHVWWRMSEILKFLPIDIIQLKDIRMISFWLEDQFDSGLASEELVKLLLGWLDSYQEKYFEKYFLLLELLFEIEEVDSQRTINAEKEAVFKLKSYQIDKHIKTVSAKSGAVLGERAIRFFMTQLIRVIDIRGGDEYSYIWRSAIEDHKQNGLARDTEDYFILALREAITAFEKAHSGAAGAIIAELIESDKNILKRIGIHCLNQFFNTYKNSLFDQILVENSLNSNLKHEMWELVKNNHSDFSQKQGEIFFQLVDNLKRFKEPDKPDLYHQAGWLAALKDGNERANKKYHDIVQELEVEPDHPGFASYTSTGWVGREDESPIPLDELKAIENKQELVQRLNDYPIEKKFREPDIEGLVNCFQAYVLSEEKENKELFNYLDEFKGLHLHFLYELIDVYLQIWRDPSEIALDWYAAWPKLIAFFESIVGQAEFWNADFDTGNAFIGCRSWAVSSMCSLLEAGCKNDDEKRSFSVENAMQVKGILDVVLKHQKPIEFEENFDAVSSAINSPRGQALEALINLALFESRAADAKAESHDDVWVRYQPIFNKELEVESNVEFYTLVPLYINNFYYLSKDWMDEHFDFFFNPNEKIKWLCSLEGFSHNSNPHSRIFELLKKEGMYERVLDEDLNTRVDKRYVDYGLIPYLKGEEALGNENSLLERLINRNDLEELRQLVWLFRFQLRRDESIQLKVLELFPRILSVINIKTMDGRKLASYLAHWVGFIDVLNEQTIKWLKEIVPYADVDYNSDEIMQAFAKWSKNYPDQVCEIWLEMLKENPGYPYSEEVFKEAYSNLLNAGLERKVKDIAGAYLKYNIDRPITWLQEVR